MTAAELARLRLDCYDRAVQLVRPQPDVDGKPQLSKPLTLDQALTEAAKIETYCLTDVNIDQALDIEGRTLHHHKNAQRRIAARAEA